MLYLIFLNFPNKLLNNPWHLTIVASVLKEKCFNKFLEAPLTLEERNYLKSNKKYLLETDRFSDYLSFGTGGMRQIVELGTNRLNIYNIAKLSLCVLAWLTSNKGSSENNKVVLGCDSRNTSTMFASLVYHLMKQEQCDVKIFKRPTPTPMVSFAVRKLQAGAGIILTASHNPPKYNGYKLMGSNGAQIISPHDKIIQKKFLESSYKSLSQDIHQWKDMPPSAEDIIEEEIISDYIEHIQKESFVASGDKKVSILYSPLHGTGSWVFERVFAALGYKNFSILKEQAEPDGNFPTVKSPNPEEPSSFDRLKESSQGAQILIATDPDADRIGLNFLQKSEDKKDHYVFLTGNQIGCLLLKSLAENLTPKMSQPYICKTIVTTELQRKIADAYGIRTVETLTGFKYIANVLEKDTKNYLFGGEESFGYLPVNWIRDKDSISSAVAIAEMANQKDLLEELDNIYVEFGLYHEKLYNIGLDASSIPLIDRLKTDFLKSDLFVGKHFALREVIDYINLNHKLIKNGDEPVTKKGRTLYRQLPEANVLQLWLQPEGRITIRPSGTEPKIKVYLSLKYQGNVTNEIMKTAKKSLQEEGRKIIQEFLTFLGVQHKI